MTTAIMTVAETRACDFCGEEVLTKAKKCKHCHETLDPAMRRAEEAMRMAATASGGSAASASATTVVVNGPDTRPNFPHLFHFALSVITVGMWSWVWLVHYLCRGQTYKR